MGKLKYLVIHCTDTTESMNVTPEMIKSWHTDKRPAGRGWSRVGYSDMIMLDGTLKNLRPYNEDDKVQDFEVTNGAAGYNGVSRHIVYAGGRDASLRKPKDTLNEKQAETLKKYVKEFIENHPEAKVIGHNQINKHKKCPSFDVPEKFVFGYGFPAEHFMLSEAQEKKAEEMKMPDPDEGKELKPQSPSNPEVGPNPMNGTQPESDYDEL